VRPRARAVALLGLAVFSCGDLSAPDHPWRQITPPATWSAEYDSVWTHCARAVVWQPRWRFDALTFYVVETDRDSFRWPGKGNVTGIWDQDRIFLVRAALTQPVPIILRHELLHAQLGRADHPPIFTFCGLGGQ
jgi:hypothetical protein